jgi:hypothetical protein
LGEDLGLKTLAYYLNQEFYILPQVFEVYVKLYPYYGLEKQNFIDDKTEGADCFLLKENF